jgi:hypothetical protein
MTGKAHIAKLRKHAAVSNAKNNYGLTDAQFKEANRQLDLAKVTDEERVEGLQVLGSMDSASRDMALASTAQEFPEPVGANN